MDWAFVLVLVVVMAFVTAACATVALARSRVNHRHRVDPRVRTDAPLTWLVDPRAPARLHRRLARVGTTATMVAQDHRAPTKRFRKVEPTPLEATAQDLCAQAVALDAQIARLAQLSAPIRRQHLPQVARSVAEVEAAAAQLVALSTELHRPRRLPTDPEVPTEQATLTAIADQLDRLTQAHDELTRLDADAGLVTLPPSTPTPARAPAPPAPQPRS